jgi:DNA helicase-2/ATP-dependent DNA helicase PcrA
MQELLSPDSAEAEKKATNISKFFDKLKTYEVDHEDATIPTVVDWLELSVELGESPLAADNDWTDVNAVNILTVHSAKGLEFPVVFLVNLVAQRFPTSERREQIPIPEKLIKEVLPVGDYHMEEERRLFYVGATRAKELLFFTAADYYGEGKREKRLSPFIFEALGDKAVSAEQTDKKHKQLSFLDYSKPAIKNVKTEIPKLRLDYLSYSQIETFKTCHLHYKLKYILRVPTLPSASQSFGTTIHATLKNFYNLVIDGAKPSEKLIQQCLIDNWVKEGYTSKSHERKFLEKGKLYMTGFLREGFNKRVLPVTMEQMFTIPLVPTDKKVRPIKIGGVIDRVDVLPDGTIEIIDYKTGANIPTQKEVDRNLQLCFYALAATNIPTTPFNKKPDQVKLSLYYLDEQEKISTIRTMEQLEKAKEEIFKVREEMEQSDFKCSGNMLCKNCEFKLLCRVEN